MRKFCCVVLSVFLALLVPKAFAGKPHEVESQVQETAPSLTSNQGASRLEINLEKYLKSCSAKLDLGVPNFLMGWTAAINEPVTHYKKQQSRWKSTGSALSSLGKGLLLSLTDTVGGALNTVTFLIPGKIPLPRNGVNIDQLIGEPSHL